MGFRSCTYPSLMLFMSFSSDVLSYDLPDRHCVHHCLRERILFECLLLTHLIHEARQSFFLRCEIFHDESCPYLIPLNYGAEVEEGKLVLYFHGAKEGTKIDKIRENPQVSYCIYGKNSLKIDYDAACKSTTSFESICGNGTAYFVEDLT